MTFEKTLYEKVQELEVHLIERYLPISILDNNKKKELFASIYESIDEYKKESDAHVDVLVEEIDFIAKSSKRLTK